LLEGAIAHTKDVGEYIDHYRVVSQQTQTEPLAYQLYRVESPQEAENPFILKTWPKANISSQVGIDTFTRQAQALVELHAPFVLPIKGYGLDDASHPYLLLPEEACTLETLAQRMKRADVEPISVKEATTILREVGTALVAAHQQGIVHGYLSPASILLTSEGSVLVAVANLPTQLPGSL
jgi:serine/threonine protein kinase